MYLSVSSNFVPTNSITLCNKWTKSTSLSPFLRIVSHEKLHELQVLPSLREKHDEFMLKELLRQWSNHRLMFRWLSRFFDHLERHYVKKSKKPNLSAVALTCFRNLVCDWHIEFLHFQMHNLASLFNFLRKLSKKIILCVCSVIDEFFFNYFLSTISNVIAILRVSLFSGLL